ncbi:DNA methyltransferase, partial [candidate division GN15 bacterium]|nr:DNA methyltransferase [candidate division GN15 bacterium]
YGQIATMAGDPRGARQVARALHSSSRKERLPWHRVVNSTGKISLPIGAGYEEQRARLEDEGVAPGIADRIDLKRYQWAPRKP